MMLSEKGLYRIIDFVINEEELETSLIIDKDNEAFNGHFPDKSILPGVCMLQIVKELTEKATGKKLRIKSGNRIKFIDIIDPDEESNIKVLLKFSELENKDLKVIASIVKREKTSFKTSLTLSEK